MTDTNQVFVNGPINAIRLEGNVNGIDKTIYLFGDYHEDVVYQSKCPSFMSDDFPKYFIKTIKKSINKNIKYDFFFETGKTSLDSYNKDNETNDKTKDDKNDDKNDDKKVKREFKKKYIHEIDELFGNSINIVNKKNIGSKTDVNLRLHHIDFRDEIYTNYIFNDMNNILYMVNTMYKNVEYDESYISEILKKYNLILDEILFVKYLINALINNKPIEKQKNIDEKKFNIYIKIFIKLFDKFNNENIKKSLFDNSILITLINNNINSIITMIEEIILLIQNINKTIIYYYMLNTNTFSYGNDDNNIIHNLSLLYISSKNISGKIISLYAQIIDIYCLKRILDKSFVTNAIVYTGMLHTTHYLVMLIKQFNFKITHISYSNIDIKKLQKTIEKNTYKTSIFENTAIYIWQPIFSQCCDMTSFPKFFL